MTLHNFLLWLSAHDQQTWELAIRQNPKIGSHTITWRQVFAENLPGLMFVSDPAEYLSAYRKSVKSMDEEDHDQFVVDLESEHEELVAIFKMAFEMNQ